MTSPEVKEWCPHCGEVLKIKARHTYEIAQDTSGGHWIKSVGDVEYSCANCGAALKTSEIRDALAQVDEV